MPKAPLFSTAVRRRRFHRFLRIEPLEDRRVLSAGFAPELPGMYLVDPDVDKIRGQVIYLDYDGEENVTYNGPVTIGPFDIPPFVAPGELAGREDAVMAAVAEQLNELFASVEVTFTLHRPDVPGTYSTVYIGGDGAWASEFGEFMGLAENVDIGNQGSADNAFVFPIPIGAHLPDDASPQPLSALVAHEVGHLIGYAHAPVDSSLDVILGQVAPDYQAPSTHPQFQHVAATTTIPAETKLYLTKHVSSDSISRVTSNVPMRVGQNDGLFSDDWYAGYATFDLSSIPANAQITNARLRYDSSITAGDSNWPMTVYFGFDYLDRYQFAAQSDQQLWNRFLRVANLPPQVGHAFWTGKSPFDNTQCEVNGTDQSISLNFDSRLEDRVGDWISLRFEFEGQSTRNEIHNIPSTIYDDNWWVNFDSIRLVLDWQESPSITVTAPNGGENWVRGTSQHITWNSANSPGANVKIELLMNGAFNSTIDSSTPNNGSYTWPIPESLEVSNNYQIKITSTTNALYSDLSDHSFSILAAPGIEVTTPVGGESWLRGTTQTITWSSIGDPGANVTIQLFRGVNRDSTIIEETPNNGSFPWPISLGQTPGTDYKVKVISTTNSSYFGFSENRFSITASPSITVTAPNGNEAWQRGTSQTITWDSSGDPGANVRIELYKAGVLNRTIASSTANAETHSWPIPADQTLGSDYKVKITSTTDSSYSDWSDNNFSISEAPSIIVTSPNGGESWQRGTTQTITWGFSGDPGANVRIELYKGGVLNRTIASSTANNGTHSWPIPADQTLGSDYKVKITSTTNSSYSDWSDNSFSITLAPSITVTAPNGGERWQRGTNKTITWSFNGDPGPNVSIELYKGGSFHSTVVASTANNGSYAWPVPPGQTIGSDYKVRITSPSNPSIFDVSDETFSIEDVPTSITVTSPNGGEAWRLGTQPRIRWDSSGSPGADVKIQLFKGGILVRTIIDSTPNNGWYDWFISSEFQLASDYRINVTSTTNSTYSDSSDGDFSITDPPVTVTAPNGGESWQRGTTQNITWSSTGSSNSTIGSIYLLKAETTFRTIVHPTTNPAPNTGSYSWDVPSDLPLGSDYKIKVCYSIWCDLSDENFSITDASIAITSPNGGETWKQRTRQTITWESSGSMGSSVAIDLYKGERFYSNIVSSTPNNGSYSWFVLPSGVHVGDDYRVRVASWSFPRVIDFSDQSFSISAPPLLVTSPNGGEVWERGSSQSITWAVNGDVGPNIDVILYRSYPTPGGTSTYIAESVSNNLSYDWDIPADQPLGNDFSIYLKSSSNHNYYDVSDSYFSIADVSSITVTAPNGGEGWQQGTTQAITWDSVGDPGANVRIELYKGGVFNRTIASSTGNIGSYSWPIRADQTLGSDYKIKITSTASSSYSDWSDSSFSITAAPSITVTAPNGGEGWQQGTTQAITWDSAGDPGANVRIELYKAGTLDGIIVASTPNSWGHYLWDIPSNKVVGSDYTIKIISTSDSSCSDSSDAYFSITPAPSITVTSPPGGAVWERGMGHTIAWTSTGDVGASVQINLAKNGFLADTIASNTPNNGAYEWFIPSGQIVGDDYRICVSSTSSPSYFDCGTGDFSISEASSIAVTAPNGGESWQQGTSQTITWDSNGDPGANVNIELYKNGVLNRTIASSTANDGTHSWPVPADQTLGSDYKVKITSSTNSSYSDWSDNSFSITAAPSITVTAPNGGESWQQGTSQTITWDSSGNPGANVNIELYKNGVLNRTIASSTANDGTQSWPVPADQTLGSDYKVKITSTTNSSYSDWSDNSFSITPAPSITVSAPNGGESWQQGTSQTITWDSSGNPGANVNVELYKNGVLNRTIASSTANDGTHSWPVPADQTLGSDYKVKITSTTNSSYSDWSDNSFSITAAPSITVSAPNGGESWQQGTSQTITWDSNGDPGANVNIELYKNGVLNRTIASSTANDGTHSWPVPADQTLGSDYKVKITSSTNSSYSDWSDNNFSITAAPSITVTAPNGGESWQQGTSQTITWDSSGNPGANVSIELYKNGVWNRTIASSTANDGTHSWPIAADQTLGSDYRIKITSTNNTSYSDWSDNNFSIMAAPSITVTAPNGGESWQQGTSQTITWDSSGDAGANVSIELHKGGVLNRTIASSTANDGTHLWLIPADQTLGSDYKVKITSTTNSSYSDWSDNSFSITAAPSITVTAPNGGEGWQQGTIQSITWFWGGDPGTHVRIELYKGGVLNRTIASSTANDGSYTWQIPGEQMAGSDYRIKITSTTNTSYFDWSDNDFFIMPAFRPTVLSPNGGEVWEHGTHQIIRWVADGSQAPFAINLYRGSVLVMPIANSVSNTGSFSWSVPPWLPEGNNYRVKIEAVFNSSYFDWSDRDFSIAAVPWFRVIAPNGGEAWEQGTGRTITWESGGTPQTNVRIELYKNGVLNRTIASSTANIGSYAWQIPGDQAAGSDYKIKITSTTNTSCFDWSDNGFSITPSRPANDNFANRLAITGTSATVTGTNVNATKETGEPSHAGNSGGKSVWWTWTPSSTSSVQIDTFGSSFDTLLGVYTGSSFPLTFEASNDDSGAGLTSKVTFGAVANTAYQIAVDGYGGASGDIMLQVTCMAPVVLVTGNGLEIIDGDTTPNTADGTDFGTVTEGGEAVSRTFTVRNTGNAVLTTSNLTVPSGFTITEELAASIAAGDSDTFAVRLDTTVAGVKSGDIRFDNNDSDSHPYNFRITGTVGGNQTVGFSDDFETYSAGSWPTGWYADGNAATSPSSNQVVTDPLNATNKVLQLYGVLGSFWGALANHPVDFGDAYTLSLRIYNGDEAIPSSGHQDRAYVGMRHGTSWTNPGLQLLQFNQHGNVIAADGSIVQSYSTARWYDVQIDYRLLGPQIQIAYRLDGVYRGSVTVAKPTWFDSQPLNHLDLTVQAGTARFDDVVVAPAGSQDPTGNVLTVNSTGDASDANPGDGICDDGTGFCTLRAAIQEANASVNSISGPDAIEFNIPGTGPHTIRPGSALPAVVDAVVIDATTQPGYAGTPLIELDGSLAGAGVSGLRLSTGGNTVKGLAINRFAASGILVLTGGENTIQGNFLGTNAAGTAAAPNAASGIDVRTAGNLIGGAGSGEGNLISGNANFGILLLGGAAENTIVGNRIGTDQTGTAAIGNALYGIYVTSPGNQIGGPAAGDGNLISGNLRGGVAVTGATATGNVVRGNRVGTMADGNAALPNGNAGITVSNVSGNTIGGTAAGAGNVLSGNALHGAMIVGAASTNNVVQGNLVGLNAAGTAAVPNGQYGITNYSPDSRIGGPAAGAGNTVSGNNFSGVLVYTPTATGVKVQGNRIGTNAAGTAAVPNGFYGVYVNSTDNLIGGPAAGEGNLISGNTRGGVALTERTAQRNVVQGNRIGTNPAGTAALANGGSGVTIAEGSDNTIGGTAAGAGNQISGNAAQGVMLVGANATGNVVRGNLIGLASNGTSALGNGQFGVAVYSSNNTIGGVSSGNTISGNAGGGVIVYGATIQGTTIQGNRIGTDPTGSLAVPNNGHGLLMLATDSLVGGTGAGEGNVIGWNTGHGIYVTGTDSTGNAIRQNSIFRNGLLGIDLAPWGPTANDPDDADTGPNRLQNFPVMTAAVLSGGTLNITYSVPSSTVNSAYPLAVEFFLADADGQEGQTYVGTHSYTSPGAADASFAQCCIPLGVRIVATATDANGNTSEFSASIVVSAALSAPAKRDSGSNTTALDTDVLEPLVWQAIAAWELAGLDAARVASLHSVTFEIADLPGHYLAWATPDRIVLDIDAAGYGWYTAEPSEVPSSEMDLLTAVLHEMGHVLGLADLDDEDELMSSILQPGTRQLPTAEDIDRMLAAGVWAS
jgi:CSLREA domain-containing protein